MWDVPVAGLTGGAEELVGVEDHDLVLVGLVDKDAMDGGGVGRHQREAIAHQPEHALHLFDPGRRLRRRRSGDGESKDDW